MEDIWRWFCLRNIGVCPWNRPENTNLSLHDHLRHCTVSMYRHIGLIRTHTLHRHYPDTVHSPSLFVRTKNEQVLSSPVYQVAIADCLNSLVYLYSRKNPNGFMAKSLSLVTGTVSFPCIRACRYIQWENTGWKATREQSRENHLTVSAPKVIKKRKLKQKT